MLKDFLSPASQELFDRIASISAQQRIRTKGELEFAAKRRSDNFRLFIHPLPGQRVLFIAEPVADLPNLKR